VCVRISYSLKIYNEDKMRKIRKNIWDESELGGVGESLRR
jgi:hypothetical protein